MKKKLHSRSLAGCVWVRTRTSDGAPVKTAMNNTVPQRAENSPNSWEISTSHEGLYSIDLLRLKYSRFCSSEIGQTPYSYMEHRSSCDPERTLTQQTTRSTLSHSHIAIFIFFNHNYLSSVTQFPFGSSFPNHYTRLLRAALILSNEVRDLCLHRY